MENHGKPDGYDLNWRHSGFNIFCEEFPVAFLGGKKD